jgi:hypothetical protein
MSDAGDPDSSRWLDAAADLPTPAGIQQRDALLAALTEEGA